MGTKTVQLVRRCNICNRVTVHIRNDISPNHVLHLLLSIVTMGLWLPIWLLLCIFNIGSEGLPICSICAGERQPKEWDKTAIYGEKNSSINPGNRVHGQIFKD
jgi:hypothetical protein